MAEKSESKEIREAIQAGEAALSSLRNAQEKLNSAKNWGIWDIVGGGFMSSLIKHSRMDDAQEYMEEAGQNLRRFEKELQDVSLSDAFSRNSSMDISSLPQCQVMNSKIAKKHPFSLTEKRCYTNLLTA